jgi:osmoprotectant transport system permease protein
VQRSAGPNLLGLNPVAVVLALLVLLAMWLLPLVLVAPNRLMSGTPVALATLPSSSFLWFTGSAALFLALTRPVGQAQKHWRVTIEICLWAAAAAALIFAAGQFAAGQVQALSPLTRITLGSAFWVLQGALALLVLDALNTTPLTARLKSLVAMVLAAAWIFALFGGWGDSLSLVVEYQQHRDDLGVAVARHVQIVLMAIVPAVVVGVPVGWWIYSKPARRGWLTTTLGFTQTFPSLALFGLLMVPLAALSQRYPLLGQWGIRGVGLAPAVLALWLYSLLPVVRGTLSGLSSVSADARQSAQAMGMRPHQVAWYVDLPLALPVVLEGLRTATNQAIGLAAVTALIGAGGLGALMFDGLFSAAHDVVLLGVLPIIALAWLADAAFQWLTPAPIDKRHD